MGKGERLEVIYTGRVQGVGFRFTAAHVAQGLRVTGYVRNLPDGNVELVVEGARPQLQEVLAGLRASPVGRYISGEHLVWGAASNEFETFSVRY